MLRTVQVFDAARLQLIAERGVSGLLEEVMVHQLIDTGPLDGEAMDDQRSLTTQLKILFFKYFHTDSCKSLQTYGSYRKAFECHTFVVFPLDCRPPQSQWLEQK